MSIKTNHATNEITLGTTTLAIDNNGVLVGADQLANPVNLSGTPIGTIVEAPSAPTDGVWLECDGTINRIRASYPGLTTEVQDGFKFTKILFPEWPTSVFWTGTSYILSFTGGNARSLDGLTWTTYTGVGSIPVRCFFHKLPSGRLVGLRGYSASTMYRSDDDGITWESSPLPSTTYYNASMVTPYSLLLFKYDSNLLYRTTDGITFTEHTLPISNKWWTAVNYETAHPTTPTYNSTFAVSYQSGATPGANRTVQVVDSAGGITSMNSTDQFVTPAHDLLSTCMRDPSTGLYIGSAYKMGTYWVGNTQWLQQRAVDDLTNGMDGLSTAGFGAAFFPTTNGKNFTQDELFIFTTGVNSLPEVYKFPPGFYHNNDTYTYSKSLVNYEDHYFNKTDKMMTSYWGYNELTGAYEEGIYVIEEDTTTFRTPRKVSTNPSLKFYIKASN